MTSVFDEAWAEFLALDETMGPTPGALAEWHRGRKRYAVWLLRVTDTFARRRQAVAAGRLGSAVVPVPPTDLHVTVWVSGFPCERARLDDDVPVATLLAQRSAVSGAPLPRLSLGAPGAFATCAFFEVHDPSGDLAALRETLAHAGAPEVRFAPYRPHLTIGRFADTRAAAPVAAIIARMRGNQRFAARPLRAVSLELVELDARSPERHVSRWIAPR